VYSNPADLNNSNGQEMTGSYNLLSDGGSNAPNLTNSIVKTDPGLGLLANNGGPTQTMLPAYGSLAVDALSVGACTLNMGQRGQPRPQNRACDMGAVELDRIFADGFEAPPMLQGDLTQEVFAIGNPARCIALADATRLYHHLLVLASGAGHSCFDEQVARFRIEAG
jgi:hypothetical protein